MAEDPPVEEPTPPKVYQNCFFPFLNTEATDDTVESLCASVQTTCGVGTTLDDTTNTCELKNDSQSTVNDVEACNARMGAICNDGTKMDPTTNTCEVDDVCPDDFSFDKNLKKCVLPDGNASCPAVQSGSQISCGTGTLLEATTCEVDADNICGSEALRFNGEKCEPIVSWQSICGAGYTWNANANSCQRDTGKMSVSELESTIESLESQVSSQVACGPGTTQDGQMCVLKQNVCGPGYEIGEDGKRCVVPVGKFSTVQLESQIESLQSQLNVVSQELSSKQLTNVCGPGTFANESENRCEAVNVCGDYFRFDEIEQVCKRHDVFTTNRASDDDAKYIKHIYNKTLQQCKDACFEEETCTSFVMSGDKNPQDQPDAQFRCMLYEGRKFVGGEWGYGYAIAP